MISGMESIRVVTAVSCFAGSCADCSLFWARLVVASEKLATASIKVVIQTDVLCFIIEGLSWPGFLEFGLVVAVSLDLIPALSATV